MALKQLSDAEALALNGTTDAETGVVFPTLLQARWAEAILRSKHQTLRVTIADLRVLEVDGNADAVAILPGWAHFDSTVLYYAGADPAVDGLTNNDITYIWAYNSGGTLTIGSAIDGTGWPAYAHVKLARVTMSAGAITAIDDLRGVQAMATPASMGSGTDASSWTVDQDSSAAKIKLDTNGATGNFTLSLVCPNLSGNGTVNLPTSGVLVTEAGTQTLTNKTIAGTAGSSFTVGNGSATAKIKLDNNGATGNFTLSLVCPNLAGNGTITLPTSGVLVTEAGTQTLTNKTITSPVIRTTWNFERYDDTNPSADINFKASRGTSGAPTQVLSGNFLGGMAWYPRDNAGFSSTAIAGFAAVATENHTTTQKGTKLVAWVTATGGVVTTTRLTINADGTFTDMVDNAIALNKVAAATTVGRGSVLMAAADANITDNSGGTPSGTIAAMTNIDVLTNSSGGTSDNTVQALTDPTDTPADADALRDDLVANLIPQLRNNFSEVTDELITQRSLNALLINAVASLAAEINDLRAKMRTAGLLAP